MGKSLGKSYRHQQHTPQKRSRTNTLYSWQTKEIADKISSDLQLIGISIIKDNQELNYTDNIPNFMKRIRSCDYALLLLSDSYFKSKNCLFEILELQKDENHWKKILPIVLKLSLSLLILRIFQSIS